MSNTNSVIIRVRGHSSLKRVSVASNATFKDLLGAVAKEFGVVVARLQLSKTPFHAPQIISAPEKQTLAALGIKNGDMIYLNGDQDAPSTSSSTSSTSTPKPATHTPTVSATSSSVSSASSSSSSSSSSNGAAYHPPAVISTSGRKLTPRCQHGPNGACFHCSGAAPTDKIEGKCNHPSGATCIHCSSHVKDSKAEPAAWLCNHPETVFCPKCVPPDLEDDGRKKKILKCDCDKSKGQECIRCIETGPAIKVDKIPFSRYMKERKGMCKFKHGPTATCPSCAPPALPSFVGKTDCNRGHAPWPLASCLACAPANAVLRQQPYRHCDSISLDAKIIQPFYFSWVRRGIANERAALLFGRYVDEPEETKNPGAIRAMVYALYDPPQEPIPGGVRLTADANDKLVTTLAMRLGLEPVGWVVCNTARSGSKYGGDVFLTGPEVQQAARFQHRYKNSDGYSRFVTLVVHHSTSNVEPIAFQISDQGVAMERDGVLATSAEDFNMLATRRPAASEQIASVVYRDKVLLPGDEYLPDDLIVKVVVTAPKDSSSQVFKFHEFPSNGGDILIQNWFQTHAKDDFLNKLSDFNLLIALTKTLGIEIMGSILDCIRNRRTVPNDAKQRFESAIAAKKLA